MKRLITKLAFVGILLGLISPRVFARGQYFNYIQQGGASVITSGQQSRTKVQRSFPGATIKVCITGTNCSATSGTLATLYSNSAGTAKANPFIAGTDGSINFWIDISSFDVVAYGPGITTQCGGASQLPCIAAFTWPNQAINGGGGSSSATTFNVKDYGAKGDLRTVTDGAISNGGTTFTSATAAFVTADTSKQIQVAGAGAAGVTLYTTISAVLSATQVTVALAASTGVSGATSKIYTDDGVDIGLAAAALQAAGGGTLLFPYGTYGTYGKGTVYSQLGTFSSLTGVTMQCDGCQVFVSGEHMSSANGVAFSFVSCTNVTVDGFSVVGEVTTTLIQTGLFHGIKFLEFYHDCVNINIPVLSVYGIGVGAEFNNNPSGVYDGLPHSRNIHIGVLDVNTCIYGLDAQYSMDDAVIDSLRTNNVVRSLFIYGSVNVTANIYSKDAYGDDVKLWSFAGYGLTNIHINFTSDATTTGRSNSGAMVTLEFIGPTAVVHRDINVHLTIVYPGSGTSNTGSCAFRIKKLQANGTPDITDRGHVLDGLTLSGAVKNYPGDGGLAGIELPDTDGKWGPTLDTWTRITLRDLTLTNAKFVRIGCAALKGPLTVENFYSDQSFSTLVIQQDDYSGAPNLGPPLTGQFKVINSSYSNQYIAVGSDRPSGIVYLNTDLTLAAGSRDQLVENTGCGSTCTATLPAATVGLTYTFTRVGQVFRVAPQVADQIRGASAANKYLQIDANGYKISLSCTTAGFWDTSFFGAVSDISFQP